MEYGFRESLKGLLNIKSRKFFFAKFLTTTCCGLTFMSNQRAKIGKTMTEVDSHISATDLSMLNSGPAKKAKAKRQPGQVGLVDDVLGFMGFVGYFPLAVLLFVPEVRLEFLGLGQSLAIDGAIWAMFLASMVIITRSVKSETRGRLEGWGHILFILAIICMVPLFFGMAIFVGLAFVGGGADGLMLVWKPALVFGFAAWTFKSMTD